MGAWNVPFTITLDKLSCAIAAGNAAVIKPSEISPTCAQVLFNIIQELDTNAY